MSFNSTPTTPGARTESKRKRIAKACIRCRQQKSKCNLDQSGPAASPPCQRCLQAGIQCILGTSNRGRRRVPPPASATQSHAPIATTASQGQTQGAVELLDPPREQVSETFGAQQESTSSIEVQREWLLGGNSTADSFASADVTAAIEDRFASTNLHNTSDSLEFLSRVAGSVMNASNPSGSLYSNTFDLQSAPEKQTASDNGHVDHYNMSHYRPVALGLLTAMQVIDLIERFVKFYHCYYPIAPRGSLQRHLIPEKLRTETCLLTAMITIAAKDLPGGANIFSICSSYMTELVSELMLGKKCTVEAVEALLLLAEWEPRCSTKDLVDVGCGEEDAAAWMHVGLALRLAALLGLDDDSDDHVHRLFRDKDGDGPNDPLDRKRLALAACYLSDRQISIRVGRPFSMPTFGIGLEIADQNYEFPALRPQTEEEDDQDSIFQARLDLTRIFSDVHENLYIGHRKGSAALSSSDTIIDTLGAFRTSINTWRSIWGTLTCSQNVKVLLQMSYEYLRLYTNAYAFQVASRPSSATDITRENYRRGSGGALPDARSIEESIDAAKSLLTIVNNFIPADSSLSYYPIRFSLYCVNAAVFLYRATSLNLLSPPEGKGVRKMVSTLISRLQNSKSQQPHLSASTASTPADLGPRYARLLDLLWQRVGENNSLSSSSASIGRDSTTTEMADPFGLQLQDFQQDFNWLDLQAVGQLVLGSDIQQPFVN